MKKDVGAASDAVVSDVDETPIAAAAFQSQASEVMLHGALAELIRDDLFAASHDHGLLLRVEPESAAVDIQPTPGVIPAEAGSIGSLSITLRPHPIVDLFSVGPRPTEGLYTRVENGHLFYGNERLRLWGVTRHFWGGPAVLDRLQHMGFNAIRLWGPRNAYTADSAKNGVMIDGDGDINNSDSFATFDRFFADAKQRGFFMLMPGTHYDPLGIMQKGDADAIDGLTADDSFLAKQFGTGSDWDAWKHAILAVVKSKQGRTWHVVSQLMFFDTRLREIYRRQVVNLLNHVNPYTGRRYADDEAVATWELNNEQGFGTLTTLGGDDEWPAYFRDELQSQWCHWLSKRYQDDHTLTRAWGELKAGESLNTEHVALMPFVHQRTDYPAPRAADVVHFLCDITDSFNQQMRKTIRAQSSAGKGAAVVPMVFDTIAQPSAAWMYNDSLGDVMSFGTYQFTFHSSLTVPPALFIMDNQSVWHKPTLIYETQSIRPDPFRAEYPLRVAALAGWQDWDGVFFHYWKGEGSQPDEGYQAAPMDLPRKGYMDGGVYPDQDPAYCASLTIAGQAFRRGAIAPAPDPVVYHIPLSAVYSFDTIRGLNMRRDTFSRGAVAKFTTTEPAALPPPIAAERPLVDAVKAGKQILYDWPNGRMIIDTPTMKAYVGQPHGAYRFSDGIVLEKVSTPFVAFAMVSADGKPLAGNGASARIYTTAHFGAHNTGFSLAEKTARDGESSGWDGNWSDAMASNIVSAGAAPVVTDPVSYQIDFPTQISGRLLDYDFAMRQTAGGPIIGNAINHAEGESPFVSVSEIAARGPAAATPPSDEPKATDPVAAGASNPLDLPDPATASLYMPVPRVGWGEGYNAVLQYLHDSTMQWTSIGKVFPDAAHERLLKVVELEPLKDLPNAPPPDVEFQFADHRLSGITMTFAKQQPVASGIAERYSKLFKGGTSTHWIQRAGGATLDVSIGSHDGHTTLTYAVHGGH